jgi:hypothetical protein
MPSIDALDEALHDLREVTRILQPRMKPDDRLADVVRRLVAAADHAKPVPVPPPVPPPSPLAGLLTARQVVERCPALTLFALKKLMFHSRTNGLEEHLIRRGRRVYFDETGFAEWLRCRHARRSI